MQALVTAQDNRTKKVMKGELNEVWRLEKAMVQPLSVFQLNTLTLCTGAAFLQTVVIIIIIIIKPNLISN